MPPIRNIAVTTILSLMLTYGVIAFFGGFQFTNNIAMNGTLAQEYNTIIATPSSPGGLFYTGNLLGSAQTYGSNFSNVGQNLNPATATSTALGFLVGFISSGPVAIYQLIAFLVQPLVALGIPTGYAIAGFTILLIMIILLGIASAILIFPM